MIFSKIFPTAIGDESLFNPPIDSFYISLCIMSWQLAEMSLSFSSFIAFLLSLHGIENTQMHIHFNSQYHYISHAMA